MSDDEEAQEYRQEEPQPTALLVFESPVGNALCERRIRPRSVPGPRQVESSTDASLSSLRWSSPASARHRLFLHKAPRVKVYKNGDDLSPDKWLIYSLASNFGQILADVAILFSMPQKARELYSKDGDMLTSCDQFTDGMIVIASFGEKFNYKKYLSQDDFNQLPRVCKYCHHFFSPGDNKSKSCSYHALDYFKGFWVCCGQESRSARGCKFGYHTDPKYDEDLNTVSSKKCVYLYLNGFLIDGKGIAVEIPSKLEVLIENCSRKLNLPSLPTHIFTDKGLQISRVNQLVDGMNIIVSTGDRFRWSLYLSQDDLKVLPRICSRCKSNYTAEFNLPTSCHFHSDIFHSTKGYWICCRKRNNKGKQATGCQTTYHFDTRFIQQEPLATTTLIHELE